MINFFHTLFYTFPLLFIWSEFYHIKYKDKLYVRFTERVNKSSLSDYIFYLTKLSYLVWTLIGLFSNLSHYFMLILLISSIKFLILLSKSKKLVEIYDTISSVLCIVILLIILFKAFSLNPWIDFAL
jgi:hypothetical protein